MTRRYVMEFERPLVELEAKLAELRAMDLSLHPDLVVEIAELAEEVERLHHTTYSHLAPWHRVQIARHPERPKTQDYLAACFTDVQEIHGDRQFGDDEAIVTAFARLGDRRVAVIGHRKGKSTKENLRRNFGSPLPEGFRKAMRMMRLADRFSLPVVTFLDTPGAYPGIEAEERGQAWAIAESLATLSGIRVPVVAVGIGEGGSGGALAIGFGDHMIMLENSYYSVSSPEACASILYRDAGQSETAATCLKMTAEDLIGLGIADEVLSEPEGGAHVDQESVFDSVALAVERALGELSGIDPEKLVERRYERLRAIGEWCTLDEGVISMAEARPRIAVLTSGGDAPGMNAGVRAVVRTAIAAGAEAVCIERGYEGLLERAFKQMSLGDVGGVLDRGGTFIGTSRSQRFQTPEGTAAAAEILREEGITGLVVFGGDGSYRGAMDLHQLGIHAVGIPGTIDNDITGTDTSIGFDTALNTVCDAVGKVRDTASSHERTFVIEVMGRSCGMLTTYAGLACGADCILVPEIPWDVESVCQTVRSGVARGKKHSIIVIAEGAGQAFGVAKDISVGCGHEVRAVVLGHVQRGGSPSAFDRILASRMGAHAVTALLEGESGVAVGLRHADTVTYPLPEAFSCQHELRREIYNLAAILAT